MKISYRYIKNKDQTQNPPGAMEHIGLDKQKFSAQNCKYFLTHNF